MLHAVLRCWHAVPCRKCTLARYSFLALLSSASYARPQCPQPDAPLPDHPRPNHPTFTLFLSFLVPPAGYSDPNALEMMRLYQTIHADHEGGNVSAHATHLVRVGREGEQGGPVGWVPGQAAGGSQLIYACCSVLLPPCCQQNLRLPHLPLPHPPFSNLPATPPRRWAPPSPTPTCPSPPA